MCVFVCVRGKRCLAFIGQLLSWLNRRLLNEKENEQKYIDLLD